MKRACESSSKIFGHNEEMTENSNSAVISTSERGEISAIEKISPPRTRGRDDKKIKSVIGSSFEYH